MNNKSTDLVVDFGKQAKDELYHLDPTITFTNHGSYGAVPKAILEKKRELQLELDKCPDKWFRLTSFDLWQKNISSLSNYLNINKENLLICENATEAINVVLKSIDFNGSKDAILATQYTYHAVLNSIDYTSKYRLEKQNQINVFRVPINFPINSVHDLLTEFEKTCEMIVNEKKLRLRLAVIDHISSATAMLFPVKEINNIIKKWGKASNSDTLILIDGAHSIGQIKINLNEYECDFYVSNLHKWFLSPRGCSFLYFNDKERLGQSLQPSYISHGYDRDLSYNFYQRGTCDKTSWFLVDDCINFYEDKLGGLECIKAYNFGILRKAVELIVKAWNTSTLEIAEDLEAPFMKMVKLPYMNEYNVDRSENAEKICIKLMRDLFVNYKIISCVVFVQNQLYIRLSCFVHNCLEDFIKLKDALLDLFDKN